LAENQKSLVGFKGYFVVAVKAAVVDRAVGTFDRPAAWLDDEPDRVRTCPRIAVSTLVQVPARHQRRKCLCVADQDTVKSCGRYHQAQPVRNTYTAASRHSQPPLRRAGPPTTRMIGYHEPGDRRPAVVEQIRGGSAADGV